MKSTHQNNLVLRIDIKSHLLCHISVHSETENVSSQSTGAKMPLKIAA